MTITRAELAEALGVSRATVSKDEKRGMPVDDVTRARRWRKKHLQTGRMKGVRRDTVSTDPEKSRPAPAAQERSEDDDDLIDDIDPEDAEIRSYKGARERREHYQGELARLSFERECGRLMEAEEVIRVITNIGTFVRLALEQLPAKLAPQLAHSTDENHIMRLLDRELCEVLNEMAKHFNRLASGREDERQGEILQ